MIILFAKYACITSGWWVGLSNFLTLACHLRIQHCVVLMIYRDLCTHSNRCTLSCAQCCKHMSLKDRHTVQQEMLHFSICLVIQMLHYRRTVLKALRTLVFRSNRCRLSTCRTTPTGRPSPWRPTRPGCSHPSRPLGPPASCRRPSHPVFRASHPTWLHWRRAVTKVSHTLVTIPIE